MMTIRTNCLAPGVLLAILLWLAPLAAIAADPIDVLVVYTPRTLSEHFAGSAEDLENAVAAEIAEASEAITNSHLDESMQYELVGIEEVCYAERDRIRLDLQWLHASPEVGALREAYGADVVMLLSGTSNYGGMAWAIFSDNPSRWTDAFLVVEAFGLGTLTTGHELGHVLGCSHNPEVLILGNNPGSNYGYLHWENEPYFRTLMSYYYFPGETCYPCQANQLNSFSSPDLWYMHDGPGGTFGQTCWAEDIGDGTHSLDCPNGTQTSIPSSEITAVGVPTGNELSNNRLQVSGRWETTAAYMDVPLATNCAEDCAAQNRVGCTAPGGICGSCGPNHTEVGDICVPALAPIIDSELLDGCFVDGGFIAPIDGSAVTWTADLGSLHEIGRVDLHFGTYDEIGNPDWTWTPTSFMNWSPPPPPPYEYDLQISSDGTSFTSIGTGTSDWPAETIVGHENGHTMIRRAFVADSTETMPMGRWMRVTLQGCSGEDCIARTGLHEIRTFGTEVALADPIRASILRLRDDDMPPFQPKRRKFKLVSKPNSDGPAGVVVPEWDSMGDPSNLGAVLHLGNPVGEAIVLTLPAENWRRVGSQEQPGYVYSDRKATIGPIKKLVLRSGRLVVVGKGSGLPSLESAPRGSFSVQLELGETAGLCAAATAREPAARFDTTRRFDGEPNSTPGGCPPLP